MKLRPLQVEADIAARPFRQQGVGLAVSGRREVAQRALVPSGHACDECKLPCLVATQSGKHLRGDVPILDDLEWCTAEKENCLDTEENTLLYTPTKKTLSISL